MSSSVKNSNWNIIATVPGNLNFQVRLHLGFCISSSNRSMQKILTFEYLYIPLKNFQHNVEVQVGDIVDDICSILICIFALNFQLKSNLLQKRETLIKRLGNIGEILEYFFKTMRLEISTNIQIL